MTIEYANFAKDRDNTLCYIPYLIGDDRVVVETLDGDIIVDKYVDQVKSQHLDRPCFLKVYTDSKAELLEEIYRVKEFYVSSYELDGEELYVIFARCYSTRASFKA